MTFTIPRTSATLTTSRADTPRIFCLDVTVAHRMVLEVVSRPDPAEKLRRFGHTTPGSCTMCTKDAIEPQDSCSRARADGVSVGASRGRTGRHAVARRLSRRDP